MIQNKQIYPVVFFLILLLFTTPFSVAAVESLEGALNAQQINALFSGKTVVADYIDSKERVLVSYFSPDGQVQQAHNGWLKKGTWKTRKDGRLCINLKGSRKDCRIIVPQGNAYMQYVVKLDGNHRYELTYTQFRSGEHLGQMSPTPILPFGTLKKKAIVSLFADKTVESVTARKRRVSQTYYHHDGNLVQLRNGIKRYGTWRVTKNGRICLQMAGSQEKCRIIVKDGDQYKKYIVKKNSHHQHSVSYQKFTAGQTFK